MTKKEVTVVMPQGQEARPVAMLVQIASKFDSKIYMEKESIKVNAKSIMGMMALGISEGEVLSVQAEGSDETAAVGAIVDYLTGK